MPDVAGWKGMTLRRSAKTPRQARQAVRLWLTDGHPTVRGGVVSVLSAVRDVLALIWVTGMALSVVPTLEAIARLTEGDPVRMCDGCRARRRSQLRSAREWAVLGRAGTQLMVMAAASLWWVAPFIPVLRRLGSLAHQPDAPAPCAAHSRCLALTWPSRHGKGAGGSGPGERMARRGWSRSCSHRQGHTAPRNAYALSR
ncbi:hypothetical protein Misp01_13740 [Microtetraspora sp. NBRC 13810]|nr:hypothetical protein Misp01_13740 [Microtetraspora sp. NBRC 13810]